LIKKFPYWNYSAVQELDKLSSVLPILPEDRAKTFFRQAGKITREKVKLVKRQSGKLFESMMGFVSASDRKDFSALLDNDNPNTFGYGVLMVETYDKIIGVTFCIVKIFENTFLTKGWIGEENRNSLKKLLSETFRLESKKWWEIWK
jgi:hypothetical protein